MQKDILSVVYSFVAITIVLYGSTVLYQKQVYAAEKLANKIEEEAQIAAQKELERVSFITRLNQAAATAQLGKENTTRAQAIQKIEAQKAAQALIQEQKRIADITNEAALQEAKRIYKAEAARQALLLDAKKKSKAVADQIAAQKALDAQIMAQQEAQRLQALSNTVSRQKSRRSRAS